MTLIFHFEDFEWKDRLKLHMMKSASFEVASMNNMDNQPKDVSPVHFLAGINIG